MIKAWFHVNIRYPHSCVLYLRYTSETPDFLTVHVEYPGGEVLEYHTPIIKLGRYELLVLLPYYILRYEKYLPDIEKDKTKLHELLSEYQHMYNRLFQMTRKRDISNYDFVELKKLIEKIMERVAVKQEHLKEGVKELGGKVLEFEHDILMKESEVRGIAIGEAVSLVKNVETLMKNSKRSLEKACSLLDITIDDYNKAKALISKGYPKALEIRYANTVKHMAEQQKKEPEQRQ